jgi:predicted Zn-dependent peptidase
MTPELNRHLPPPVRPAVYRPLPPYRSLFLRNGLPVHLLPHGEVEVCELMLVFKAGDAYQPYPGLADYTVRNLVEGTRSYTSDTLAQKLDEFGAWLHHDVDNEYISVNLSGLTRHLPGTLPLLAEAAFFPAFPEQEFQQMKQRALQKLQVSAQKTAWVARRQFNHLLFGPEHPYGIHLGPEEVGNVAHEDLLQYHAQYFHAGNAFLVVSGQYEEGPLMGLLEQYLGGLPAGAPNLARSAAEGKPYRNLRGRHHFPVEGMQSSLYIGRPGLERSHPDFYAAEIVNTLLGGYFGSRLMKNIREEKGYTYGIHSIWGGLKHGGFFRIQTDLANEYVEPALAEVYREMERLASEGADAAELELVRNYLIGRNGGQRESAAQMADLLRFSISQGLPFAEMDRRFEVLAQMKPEEVAPIAQRYFRPGDMLEIVAGALAS